MEIIITQKFGCVAKNGDIITSIVQGFHRAGNLSEKKPGFNFHKLRLAMGIVLTVKVLLFRKTKSGKGKGDAFAPRFHPPDT